MTLTSTALCSCLLSKGSVKTVRLSQVADESLGALGLPGSGLGAVYVASSFACLRPKSAWRHTVETPEIPAKIVRGGSASA